MIITLQRNERHASQKIAEKIELFVTNRHCQEMNIVRHIFGGGGHWGNIRRRSTVMYRREENSK